MNGVSLTVCGPTDDTFTVAIIPYTRQNTNFKDRPGSVVNIELTFGQIYRKIATFRMKRGLFQTYVKSYSRNKPFSV